MNIKTFFNDSIKLITPKIYNDNRGYFFELYNQTHFNKKYSLTDKFVQDNISFSKQKYTIRGMHLQTVPFEQSKLVSVITGSIRDYFIDLRVKSKTFGKFGFVNLNSKKKQFLYIKKGFAHGFVTLEKNTTVLYKVSNYYSQKNELTLSYLDKTININWNLKKNKPSLSKKDVNGKSLEFIKKYL